MKNSEQKNSVKFRFSIILKVLKLWSSFRLLIFFLQEINAPDNVKPLVEKKGWRNSNITHHPVSWWPPAEIQTALKTPVWKATFSIVFYSEGLTWQAFFA